VEFSEKGNSVNDIRPNEVKSDVKILEVRTGIDKNEVSEAPELG
jgi:hypothetical protein